MFCLRRDPPPIALSRTAWSRNSSDYKKVSQNCVTQTKRSLVWFTPTTEHWGALVHQHMYFVRRTLLDMHRFSRANHAVSREISMRTPSRVQRWRRASSIGATSFLPGRGRGIHAFVFSKRFHYMLCLSIVCYLHDDIIYRDANTPRLCSSYSQTLQVTNSSLRKSCFCDQVNVLIIKWTCDGKKMVRVPSTPFHKESWFLTAWVIMLWNRIPGDQQQQVNCQMVPIGDRELERTLQFVKQLSRKGQVSRQWQHK